MKIQTIFFFVIVLILLIGFANAESSYVFKKDTDVELKVTCFDINNTLCNSETKCQITIWYKPNNTVIVENGSMSFNNNYYNYTLDGNKTNINGEYSVTTTCQGTSNGFSTFSYEVNPTGIRSSEQRTGAMTRSIYFIFGIAFFFFLTFLFINASASIKWTFFILAMIFILIGINIVFVSLQDEVVNPNLENLFSFLTAASFYLYWFAGGLLLFIWILTFVNTWFYNKNIKSFRKYGGS